MIYSPLTSTTLVQTCLSSMTMCSVRLTSLAKPWGGLDAGSSYLAAHSGLATIDFTYNTNVSVSGDDLLVTPAGVSNTGTVSFFSNTYYLWDKSDGNFSIKFNDEDDHRLFRYPAYQDNFVGLGWLNHFSVGDPNVSTSRIATGFSQQHLPLFLSQQQCSSLGPVWLV
jgi:hypothetical protein